MAFTIPLFPEQASTMAGRVDNLFYYLCGVSIVFSLLIAFLVIFFVIRYRRRPNRQTGVQIHGSNILEAAWSIIPLGLTVVMFVWGAIIYLDYARPPDDALDIYVVGKQWMWKIQHEEGQSEINELHIPVGRPIKLTMTSEDVIHDFFIPAFRVKADVLPKRYTTLWFEATRPGRYHLFCAEYCGTKHSEMIGWVYVMEPAEYEEWLAGEAPAANLASVGEALFEQYACITCHREDSGARGPHLDGLFGAEVVLASGEAVTADEIYIRESILHPAKKVVAGYDPIMPTFEGQVSEEGLMGLIAYIKSRTPSETDVPADS